MFTEYVLEIVYLIISKTPIILDNVTFFSQISRAHRLQSSVAVMRGEQKETSVGEEGNKELWIVIYPQRKTE